MAEGTTPAETIIKPQMDEGCDSDGWEETVVDNPEVVEMVMDSPSWNEVVERAEGG